MHDFLFLTVIYFCMTVKSSLEPGNYKTNLFL